MCVLNKLLVCLFVVIFSLANLSFVNLKGLRKRTKVGRGKSLPDGSK